MRFWRHFQGFGHHGGSDGLWTPIRSEDDLLTAFDLARKEGRAVVQRGAGRSYGDAAHAPEALVLDFTGWRDIESFDPETGLLIARPGMTLEDAIAQALPQGWFPNVVSGTAKITLGGATAMNIHGKNNFRKGVWGEHLAFVDVVTPRGERLHLTPDHPDFPAFVGSFGVLGCISRVGVQMANVPGGNVRVRARTCRTWDDHFRCFEEEVQDADYAVSWVDAFSPGAGLFHSARYEEGAPETLSPAHQALKPRPRWVVPATSLLTNRAGMRAVNFGKRLLSRDASFSESLCAFSFLLDSLPGWERAYRQGFHQVQFFIPAEHAPRFFAALLEALRGNEPYLAVLKRHRPDRFLVSHGLDGFSLALDFAEGVFQRAWPVLSPWLDRAIDLGGRFYPAKDSLLTGPQWQTSFGPAWAELVAKKAALDPEGLLRSNLWHRMNSGE